MAEVSDPLTMIETVGPGIIGQIGRQLESVQDAISLNPPDQEVEDSLGKEATLSEREAYRRGHQSGWFKGGLTFGCAILAALAVLTYAISGRSK